MTDLIVKLPDDLAEELRAAGDDFLVEVIELGLRARKVEQALAAYARGRMTLGAAARQAGVSESEMARYAYAHGLTPPFSSQTVAEELGA